MKGGQVMKNRIISLLLSISFVFGVAIYFAGCGNQNYVAKFSKNVNEYKMEISVDEINHCAKVNQSVMYINKTDTSLNNICFHLYPNSFAKGVANKPVSVLYENKAYPNGDSYGGVELKTITINNNECKTTLIGTDKTILNVELFDELYPTDSVTINFEYELTLPNINHRFGYGNNAINFGNFYPIACVFENGSFVTDEYHYNGDPFYSDVSNYTVTIKNYKDYTLASTGSIISQSTVDNLTTTMVKAQAVRDFAFVLSNKFQVKSVTENGTEIKYYYYNDTRPEDSLQTAVDSVATFNRIIGNYPYQTLSVVETNFVHGGMEYPNLVMISDVLEKYEDYQNTIIHEIAHQWWYGMVGNNEYNYGWLDEGLTEYSTALFYEQNPNYALSYDEIMTNANSSYCMFVEVYQDIFGEVDTSMDRKLSEYKTEPEYVYISYVKGVLLFDSLREILGEKTFNKCLKKYFETNKGKNVTPQDMINSFEKTSLRSLHGFFDSWIEGTVVVVPREIKHQTN